ncbi:HlyD family secretion protein [Acinetobacter baumannii]|nr:HlyD family secretion protein [Acinetobacter baumannii]
MSKEGLVPVYLPKSGFIIKTFVNEGSFVSAQQPLLSISNENYNYKDINETLEKNYSNNLNILNNKKNLIKESNSAKKIKLNEEIKLLKDQLSIIKQQIVYLKKKNNIIYKQFLNFSNGLKEGALSSSELAQKETEFYDAGIKIKDLEQQYIKAEIEISTKKNDLKNIPVDEKIQVNSINSEINNLINEKNEKNITSEIIVKSPISGNISALQVKQGTYYNNSKPMAILVPKNSEIEAILLVPSTSIGSIKIGDPVNLKYSAYPYQKFGQGKGKIYFISNSSLSSDESNLSDRQHINEPMYIVKVRLDKKFLSLNGVNYLLKPGIKTEANIIIEEKSIIHWIVDPIVNIFD